jgi:hypothetical protein
MAWFVMQMILWPEAFGHRSVRKKQRLNHREFDFTVMNAFFASLG